LRRLASVEQSSDASLQRSFSEKGFHPTRKFEHRAMISLDRISHDQASQTKRPVQYSNSSVSFGANPENFQSAANFSASSELGALLESLEKVLRDSNTRSQQARFSTILRDFDLCFTTVAVHPAIV
jgi:hypothetical protein